MIKTTPNLPCAPLLLLILDGWGYRKTKHYNAIAAAHTPFWDYAWQTYAHTLVNASGLTVGLPDGQMGNSEVGHLHIGAGRRVLQELTRIDLAIQSGEFDRNPILKQTITTVIQKKRSLHVIGLLSPGGVHSHQRHIEAFIKLAANSGLTSIYLHAFLDGRDVPPQSAHASLLAMTHLFKTLQCGQIASLIGRYYAMDRDKRWERTQSAYDLLTQGVGTLHVNDACEGLQAAYARGETDEFIQPTAVHTSDKPITIQDEDAVVFMNFRSDRARQLTYAFTKKKFTAFKRISHPQLSHFVTLTDYASDIDTQVVFKSVPLSNHLGEWLAKLHYKQLRLAETEKYAHVTFFLNGGEEKPYPGEDRILVPSPKVATYDLQPDMSAYLLTKQLITAIDQRQHHLIICNFANPDMLGHTGHFEATLQSIETIDHCLARIIPALKKVNGEVLITADHGNAECMFDLQTQQAHTAHTTNLVPVLYIGRSATVAIKKGVLSDIAPTLLYLLGIKAPKEMTGKTLFLFS